jgi:alkylation response protein AidB-like acyl-CoA dehydrogenase
MACCSGTGAVTSFLPDAGLDIVCGDGMPIVGGQGAPRGRATPESDGYRLTGLWGYGSGTLHSDYVLSSAMVMSDDGSPPKPRAFVVPAEQIEFRGNWDVLGLRATGSVDYAINNAYVPKELTFQLDVYAPLRGGGLMASGVAGSTPFGHSAFAIGVGRRILTEIRALANSAGGRPSALADGVGEGFEERYGVAEGRLRAGRALIYEVCEEFDATIAKGDPISTRQITLIRLALNTATEAALQVAEFGFRTAGGVSLRSGALQASIRNMWAGGQHRIVSTYMLRECARELLGRTDGKVWGGGGLVDPPVVGV